VRSTGLLIAVALAAALSAAAANAKTPIPAKAEGSGNEPTAGGGTMAGQSFSPHYAVALLDITFDQVEVYLFAKKVACSDVAFATPPFVDVIVDSQGAPLLVGKPSLQNGHAFTQVEFHPTATKGKYFAIQPGASITFTRADPARNGVWHGKLSVKRQTFEKKVFAYDGTFAATWCGKN
jgi:NADH:ubiquinone oxidoreductase subunit 3 (subunit A)